MTKSNNLPKLKIGDLTIQYPIIQGGMGVGISGASLASAVANAGGIGVISAVGLGMNDPDFQNNFKEANKRALKQEIQKARSLSKGIIGVNIMVALSDYDDLVEAAIEEDIDVLFLGAGLPLKFPDTLSSERLRTLRTKLVPIVSSGKAAQLIMNFWQKKFNRLPDAFVVEGPMAGGHLGFKPEQIDDPNYKLEKLVSDVIDVVRSVSSEYDIHIPVIAAGGVFTGEDIHHMLSLGAEGVQMGTRFVATHECDAEIRFKQTYIDAKENDLTLIKSPVGLPGRAINNAFLKDVSAGIKKPFQCPWKCLRTCDYQESPYCIALALMQAKQGKLAHGFAFAGSNAWRINEIVSVPDLIQELLEAYEHAAEKVAPIEV